MNSQFSNASTFLLREPIFSSENNCLYKAILINLEISSYFHYEIRQFIVKCIKENSKNLINPTITEEKLLNRKNNILYDDNYGEDIELYIISNYLDINMVILNQQYIVKKIFQNNEN